MKILLLILFILLLTIECYSQWVQQNSGTTFISMYDVKMTNSGTGYVAGYYPDGFGWIYRTFNAGTNWSVCYQTQNPLVGIEAVSFSSDFVGTAVGGDIFGNGSFIIRTTNGGSNWVSQTTGTNFYHLDIQMIDDNTGYICGAAGTIFKTTNGGTNWNQQTSGTTHRLYGISFMNTIIGLAAGDTGTILRSLTSGTSWTTQTTGTTASLYDISMFDSLYSMAVGAGGTILKSTNQGMSWIQLNSGVTVPLRALSFMSRNVCFAVGDSGKVLKTTNGGTNWVLQASTLTQSLRGVSFTDTITGTAVGDEGKIIRTTNGGITLVEPASNEVASQFFLSQNYPNPFNPSTKIKFDISSVLNGRDLSVQLKIYDIIGREIATLVNEQLNPGTYELDWNASNFPSGLYFYKLITESFIETKKMILLK